eukprot:s10153_g2.t1
MTQLYPPPGAPIAICSSIAIIYQGLDREVRGQLLEDRSNQQGCLVRSFQHSLSSLDLLVYGGAFSVSKNTGWLRALLIGGSPALTQQEATSVECGSSDARRALPCLMLLVEVFQLSGASHRC